MAGSLLPICILLLSLLHQSEAWNLLAGLTRNLEKPAAATKPVAQQSEAPAVTRLAKIHIPVPTTPASAPPGVQVAGGDVRVTVGDAAYTLLRGFDGRHLEASTPASAAGGAFLSLGGLADRSTHRLSLGTLDCERFLAGARTKRWWMGPAFGATASEMPGETQFLLCELAPDAYALLLPTVRTPLRCTLDRSNKADELQLHCQSGDSAVRASEMDDALYITAGSDPYALLEEGFASIADRLGTFKVRSQKSKPGDIEKFGWCTWDAFYQAVDPEGIRAGLRSLTGGGTPPQMIIIDDGWQTVTDDPKGGKQPESKKKESSQASSKSKKKAGAAPATAMGAIAELQVLEAMEECDDEEEEECVLDDHVAADGETLNDPTKADGTNPVVDAVCDWYRDHVDGKDGDAGAVRVWRALANSVLKPALAGFFIEQTEFTKRLSAFEANGKFEHPKGEHTLKSLVEEIKDEFNGIKVYCWHTLGGYWGGVSVSSDKMQHLEPREHKPGPTKTLLEVEPALSWDAAALCGVGAVGAGHEHALFHGIHTYLSDSGVDGVKIDAQSGLAPMGEGGGGGPNIIEKHVQAMEASVAEHFDGNRCINCMCHSTENLYNYRSTSLLRVADDFYPNEDASQPVHLVNVAYNSLFLGEVGHADWDMFTTTHKDAAFHAAARAVGGTQIYVSDKPGQHDFDLLRQLVLPDGTALVAQNAGRPTRDVLFHDVNSDGVTALKVWNRNSLTGVIGVFNAQGARWSRHERKFVADDEDEDGQVVVAEVRARDVEGLVSPPHHSQPQQQQQQGTRRVPLDELVIGRVGRVVPTRPQQPSAKQQQQAEPAEQADEAVAMYSYRKRELNVVGADEAVPIEVARREWEVVTASPIQRVGHVSYAPLGLLDMINGGGALLSSELNNAVLQAPTARTVIKATGEFGAYCSHKPRQVLVDGSSVDAFAYDDASGLLTVQLPREAKEAEISVVWRRQDDE